MYVCMCVHICKYVFMLPNTPLPLSFWEMRCPPWPCVQSLPFLEYMDESSEEVSFLLAIKLVKNIQAVKY